VARADSAGGHGRRAAVGQWIAQAVARVVMTGLITLVVLAQLAWWVFLLVLIRKIFAWATGVL
jgi:hypothetical protein